MMQIQDMVKLIYQNEFAGGHMIENEEESLKRLNEECRHIERHFSVAGNNGEETGEVFGGTFRDAGEPFEAFEDIGNGLCRFNLAFLKNTGISTRTLNRFFVNTANSVRGSVKGFEGKLGVLTQYCRDGQLPFSLEELEVYISDYKSKGYPPVSHSEAYRKAYSPSYRIICSEYRDFFEAFSRIDALLESGEKVYAAIEGNSGAGKSTLAALIGSVYDCNIFHMDHFFLTPELRTPGRLNEVGGNVDYMRFKKEVIEGLKSGKQFSYRVFDCSICDFSHTVHVTPKNVNIIEGSYSMHPVIRDIYNLKIFMHVEEKEQSQRILKREGPMMHKRFIEEWIPRENRYINEMGISEKCDLVF